MYIRIMQGKGKYTTCGTIQTKLRYDLDVPVRTVATSELPLVTLSQLESLDSKEVRT